MSYTVSRRYVIGLPLLGSLVFSGTGFAQSTASQLQEVIVTTARKQPDLSGAIVAETATKARASITQEYIATQSAGQTILQSLNLTPGLNFTNNDAYGSAGGNIRLRGFDGNRVSLTFDGIPLNDTGNYAVYTNQQLDGELIERANVNLGTTDVDSPTASATGGTINYLTRRPSDSVGGLASLAAGSNNYRRGFGLVDLGSFGPWGTTAFLAASQQSYDKFKGPGELRKRQFNGRLYQTLGDNGFVSVSAHYNENRNNNYRTMTLAEFQTNGREFDFEATCYLPSKTGVNGVAENDGSSTATPLGTPANCSNYYGRQINPSNTGNLRLQSSYRLTDALRITFDPSFQYVLADGGSQTGTIAETDKRLIGTSAVLGLDLNGDGDTRDTVRFFTPSVTNTRRVGATSSLIWDFSAGQRLRAAYTWDRGRHTQTGAWGYLLANGNAENIFGGLNGRQVLGADGSVLRNRDRYSIAELQQVSADYRGQFLDDRLTVNAGLRSPTFKRSLNQYCYSQNASTNVRCTTELASSTLHSGNVLFSGTSSTQWIAPFSAKKQFDDVLPNLGASLRAGQDGMVYLSYAEGLSAPRTDNLYTVVRQADGSLANPGVQPETTATTDLGYRYNGERAIASATVWSTKYKNRIVSAYDEALGAFVDRNVGSVDQYGVDSQFGFTPVADFSLLGTISYNHSKVKGNVALSATTSLPTAGKQLVETPEWTFGGRAEWRIVPGLRAGLQGKYVDQRFSTDVNDQVAPGYAVFDFDLAYAFEGLGARNLSAQFNVVNLFDRTYFGSISSRNNAVTITGVQNGSAPTYNLGAPRTLQLSLRADF